jgi:hypothetical protein
VAEKNHYYPTPCPEDLLNKNLNYHQKLIENDLYSGNPLNKKKLSYLRVIFDTFSVPVMQDLFPFSKMGLFKFHSCED